MAPHHRPYSPAPLGYANATTWSGSNGNVNLSNSYFYNAGDQRVIVTTTITALSDLTNLAFNRSIDPDPDVNTFGSYSTNNQRGNSLFGADDFVSGSGPLTGLTLALVNLDTNGFTHATIVSGDCCDTANPYDVLAHNGDVSDPLTGQSSGDYGLNLAYAIGNLSAASMVTLTYAYAVGANVDTTGTSGTPEPETWAMMLVGFGGIGAIMRRRATKVTFA